VGLNEMLMDYSDNISKFVKDVNDFGFGDYEDLEERNFIKSLVSQISDYSDQIESILTKNYLEKSYL
jgi:hypothetical protein